MRSKRKSYRIFLLIGLFILAVIIALPLINNIITNKIRAAVNEWVISKDATTSSLKFYYNDAPPVLTVTTGGTVTANAFVGSGAGLTNVGSTMPQGAVMFFNLTACPSGWSELTAAKGRYIVGLPTSGTLGAIQGTALSNQENRPVGQHNHFISDPGHFHYYTYVSAPTINPYLTCCASWWLMYNPSYFSTSTSSSTTNISIQNSGSVSGTNAPYLQLLACQKT